MKPSEKPYAEVNSDLARPHVTKELTMERLTATLSDFKMFKENKVWIDLSGFIREKLSAYRRQLEIETEHAQVLGLQHAIREMKAILELPDMIIENFAAIKEEEVDDVKVEQAMAEREAQLKTTNGGVLTNEPTRAI